MINQNQDLNDDIGIDFHGSMQEEKEFQHQQLYHKNTKSNKNIYNNLSGDQNSISNNQEYEQQNIKQDQNQKNNNYNNIQSNPDSIRPLKKSEKNTKKQKKQSTDMHQLALQLNISGQENKEIDEENNQKHKKQSDQDQILDHDNLKSQEILIQKNKIQKLSENEQKMLDIIDQQQGKFGVSVQHQQQSPGDIQNDIKNNFSKPQFSNLIKRDMWDFVWGGLASLCIVIGVIYMLVAERPSIVIFIFCYVFYILEFLKISKIRIYLKQGKSFQQSQEYVKTMRNNALQLQLNVQAWDQKSDNNKSYRLQKNVIFTQKSQLDSTGEIYKELFNQNTKIIRVKTKIDYNFVDSYSKNSFKRFYDRQNDNARLIGQFHKVTTVTDVKGKQPYFFVFGDDKFKPKISYLYQFYIFSFLFLSLPYRVYILTKVGYFDFYIRKTIQV